MKLNVYFAWHNSYPEYNKNFIYPCIKEACARLENKDDLQGVFFNVINVEDSKGSKDFVEGLKERQKITDIQINDLTTTLAYAKFLRHIPGFGRISSNTVNNNVILEMRNETISPEQHIHVMNVHYGKSDLLPADIRNNTVTVKYDYSGKDKRNEKGIREKLILDLCKEINRAAFVAIQRQDEKYKPFVTWYTQSKAISGEKRFQTSDSLDKIKETIRSHNNGVLRLVGLSGLGKTRIVYESFSDDEELKRNYRYYNFYNNVSNLLDVCNAIKRANANDEKFVFVLDNCDKKSFRKIKSLVHDNNLSCPIITIFNDPSEESEKDDIYINFEKDFVKDAVQKIIQEELFNAETKEQIESLSSGNTQMACLLIDAYQEAGSLNVRLNDVELMDKLVGFERNTDERKIMQSFSLFDFIGIEEPNEEQYEFLAKTTCITSISGDETLKIQKFFEVYKQKEKLFEKNGSLVSVRPKPLAFHLAEEWFNTCTPKRMMEMLFALDSYDKHGSIMIESLAKQIQVLGYNGNAQILTKKIMKRHGPFDFAEVLGIPAAMRFFRSFVQINPIAVAELLERVVLSYEIDALHKLLYTRRDLVWTVETICFGKDTFSKGAKIMLYLAVAENETYGNNATNQFIRLFSPVLSGTETNLNTRFVFLKANIKKMLYKSLILKAIARAFSWNVVYWCGAEQQGVIKKHNYEPSHEEMVDYSKKCLVLLKNEIENETEYSTEAKEIISGAIREFVRQNILKELLPVVEEIIRFVGRDWNEMRESLLLIEHFDYRWIDRNTRLKINELRLFLSPESFITRFRIIADKYRFLERQENYQKERELYSQKYAELAQEFSESALLSDESLNVIYTTKGLYVEEFGKELAKIDKDNEDSIKDFIDASVKLLNTKKNGNDEILFYYITGAGDFALEYIKKNYCTDEKILKMIYRVAGAKGFELSTYNWLFDYVDTEEKNLFLFDDFASYYYWYSQPEDEIDSFMNKVCSYNKYGFSVLLSMLHKIFYFEQTGCFYSLANKMVDLIKAQCDEVISDVEKDKLYGLAVILLKKYTLPELAIFINKVILQSLAKTKRHDGNGYYKSLYDILCNSYFAEVWSSLSTALLSEGEEVFLYLNLEFALGTMIGSYTEDDILHTDKNRDAILDWCEKYPNKAPLRLIRIIPFFTKDNEPTEFVLELVGLFGNNLDFLEAVHSKVNSFMLKGSLVPYYEHLKEIWNQFIPLVSDSKAKEWINKEIQKIDDVIANAQRNEAEEKMIYGC